MIQSSRMPAGLCVSQYIAKSDPRSLRSATRRAERCADGPSQTAQRAGQPGVRRAATCRFCNELRTQLCAQS